MACLAVPHFRDPDGVRVGRIRGDDVAQASGHILNTFEQDCDQGIALARHGPHLSN
jgi:hypothetical protein